MACNPLSMSPMACTDKEVIPIVNNGQCLSDIMAHTGICVDPTNIAPINCLRHQAPHGYKYINQNGVCLLMRIDTGQIVTQAGYAPPVIPTAAPVANAAGDIVAGASNWVMNNKGLAAVIAGIAIWAISKNK